MGLSKRQENKDNRHSITLHSFRRHVKTTISDLGHSDYSEWFIGHSHSTHYRKPQSEKLELFRKIEPYLTYLDYSELEANGADIETKLSAKDRELQDLSKKLYGDGILKKVAATISGVRESKKIGKTFAGYFGRHKN